MATGRIIHVDMRHWERGKRGEILKTDGVDASVAIALSNPVKGLGYLGHFSPDDRGAISQMLTRATREAGRPGDVLLWYGGAAPAQRNEPQVARLDVENVNFRAYIDQVLSLTSFVLQQRTWLPIGKWLTVELAAGASRCMLRPEEGHY